MVSCPHIWTSVFVKNDHKDFVAACLERSRNLPLTVSLDLKYGDYHDYPDCTCIQNEWSPGMQINEDNPCRYHTTIDPLLEIDCARRIRKLDVRFTMMDASEEGPDQDFQNALDDFDFFTSSLPSLETLAFSVDHEFDVDTHLNFPESLFNWENLPPLSLRHLTLYGCYGGPIPFVSNLTSFELAGTVEAFGPIALTYRTFLPFIYESPSLVSLILSQCGFSGPKPPQPVTPAKLPKLKTLRLTDVYDLADLPNLLEVPALKTLSSLCVSSHKRQSLAGFDHGVHLYVRAKNDDGFQLFYNTSNDDDGLVSDWVDITRNADPCPIFVRFEGQTLGCEEWSEIQVSPLPLFVNAKVLEIGAPFADLWYPDFWKDLEKIGPQLTTLRLEVIEGMDSTVATLVKKFAEERFKKGMPLNKLERMESKGNNEEEEETAKRLWEEFRVGLNIDSVLGNR